MLSQHLNLEQKQTLIMTPRLQQAIRLLQYSSLELNQYIENELKSNPMLEKEEEYSADERLEISELDKWDELLENGYEYNREKVFDPDRKNVNYETFVVQKPCLTEHLLSQFRLLAKNEKELKIGEYIIGSLDEKGFLTITPGMVSKSLGVKIPEVKRILRIIHTLDPVGVGTKNLIESLLIQCRYHYGELPLVERIIKEHLNDLSQNRIKQISAKLKVSPSEVQKAADLIKTLNPKPASNFSSHVDVKYLEPDVFIQKVGEDYVVVLNDKATPGLKINSYYRNILKNMPDEEEARNFLEKKLNSALWLIKSIEQRKLTIYRICETLVELQRPFLDRGLKYLQPMTLNEVAEKVGVHESTVSRATSNKYVQTPYGIFELKFFFNSGISGNEGEGLASVGVKEIIQELIKGEDSSKPLSDQKITEIIQSKGYNISRRTVAKYRDELGIPSSSKRRRYD